MTIAQFRRACGRSPRTNLSPDRSHTPECRVRGSAPGHETTRSPCSRYLVERHVLVHADIRRKTKDPFRDDVAEDLVGAAGDAQSGRAHPAELERPGRRPILAL